jgi:hypothetical protein
MIIYFHVFPKNGTAKPAMTWEVMELPAFSTEKSGQIGGRGLQWNKQYCSTGTKREKII